MRNTIRFSLFISFLVISAFYCSNAPGADANDRASIYDSYRAVLKSYVNDTGMVNYKQLKSNRQKLDAFVFTIAGLDAKTFANWSDTEKIAFWLNAYNALTLVVIIDNYPIKPSFLRSRLYPKNSIRQIKGVWNKKKFTVLGRQVTLEHIEHKILRVKFDEPRIHMAMVCAAMGCPPLLNAPYTTARLDKQLDGRGKKFLSNPKKFRIDRKAGQVYISPIFKWFADDFVAKYSSQDKPVGFGKKEKAVLNFISKYLEGKDAGYIINGKYDIEYLKYDWSLNEQTKKVKSK